MERGRCSKCGKTKPLIKHRTSYAPLRGSLKFVELMCKKCHDIWHKEHGDWLGLEGRAAERVCSRCGHEWVFSGTGKTITCPNCLHKVRKGDVVPV